MPHETPLEQLGIVRAEGAAGESHQWFGFGLSLLVTAAVIAINVVSLATNGFNTPNLFVDDPITLNSTTYDASDLLLSMSASGGQMPSLCNLHPAGCTVGTCQQQAQTECMNAAGPYCVMVGSGGGVSSVVPFYTNPSSPGCLYGVCPASSVKFMYCSPAPGFTSSSTDGACICLGYYSLPSPCQTPTDCTHPGSLCAAVPQWSQKGMCNNHNPSCHDGVCTNGF